MRKYQNSAIQENIVCIIQARVGSSRLPYKIGKKINGISILEFVYQAAINSYYITSTKIAFPKTSDNQYFINESRFINKEMYGIYDVDENDLLSRYWKCYEELKKQLNNIRAIVRITADCPILYFYPSVIDSLIYYHIKDNYDYSWNRCNNFRPSGLDVEVFNPNVLKELYLNKDNLSTEEKEHVTLNIRNNQEKYNIFNQGEQITSKNGVLFNTKFSIDTMEDFKKVSDCISLLNMYSQERGN